MKLELSDRMFYYRPIQPGAEGATRDHNIIEAQFMPGPEIDDFKRICATLAIFLGYHVDQVKETFGLSPTDQPIDVKILEYNRK